MRLFASDRERRLWLWSGAVVVASFSTLGLAGTIAGVLGQSLEAAFFLGLILLVGAAVAVQGVEGRIGRLEVDIATGVLAAYLLLFFRMTLAERSHLIEYGLIGLFLYEALAERSRQGRGFALPPALLAIVAATLLGLLDETVQLFIPDRHFDPWDMLFNALACTMAVGASRTLHWARERGARDGGGRPDGAA